MRYFSTFSGIGGFELGIQRVQSTAECIGFSEIDKYAIQVYQKHFPKHTNYGDITRINAETLPDFDMLVGGFPCQAFSIAGKRKGFEDTRGTLFFELARILRTKQPRLFVFENVKGLLSHDNGQTFATIISTIDELGYDLQWQVLNSKNHGVPQNRERVFIVGHLRGTPRPKVFPFAEADRENTEPSSNRSSKHTQTITSQGGLNSRGSFVENSYALDANYHKGTNTIEKSRRQLIQVNNPTHSNDRVYSPNGISPTLNTMQGGNRQPFIQNPKLLNYKKDYENSVAITATSYKEPPVVSGVRRLTPKECERLQGFPDNWTDILSDTQRYKTLGNAVTVNVIQAIMERLLVYKPLAIPKGDD